MVFHDGTWDQDHQPGFVLFFPSVFFITNLVLNCVFTMKIYCYVGEIVKKNRRKERKGTAQLVYAISGTSMSAGLYVPQLYHSVTAMQEDIASLYHGRGEGRVWERRVSIIFTLGDARLLYPVLHQRPLRHFFPGQDLVSFFKLLFASYFIHQPTAVVRDWPKQMNRLFFFFTFFNLPFFLLLSFSPACLWQPPFPLWWVSAATLYWALNSRLRIAAIKGERYQTTNWSAESPHGKIKKRGR